MTANGAGREATLDDDRVAGQFCDELVRLRPVLARRALLLARNPSDADDLVQDTLERALLSRGQFRVGTNLMAWMSSIMKNLHVDHWRRTPPTTAVDADALADCSHEDREPRLIDVLDPDDVGYAVAHLAPMEREVFELAHIQHVAYRDIAARLRLPMNTVGTRLFRARARARKLLEQIYSKRRSTPEGALTWPK